MSDIPPAPPGTPPTQPPVTTPPTTPPTPPQPPTQPPTPPAAQQTDTTDADTDWKAEARKWEARAKTNSDAAAQLKEIEDAKKTDEDRLKDELATAQTTGTEASTNLLRLEVALDKAPPGMDLATVRELAPRLQGGTREELEADAAKLFAVAPQLPTTQQTPATGTPVENLRPGALPTQQPTPLPEQIAAAETAGDWETARQLKSQQLAELHQKTH